MTGRIGFSLALMLGGLGVFQGPAIADTILEVRNGSASIENPALRRLRAAKPGMALRVGDLIQPYLDAVVVIRCESGSTRRVRSLVGLGDLCPDSVGRRFTMTGRGEDDFLLFLNGLFTYSTQVTEAHPVLRWNPVEGATIYRVEMFQDDEVIWNWSGDDTRVPYGGEGLEPGASYVFIVTAIDQDGEERRSRLLLRRLSEAEATSIQDAVTQVEAQGLSDEGRAIALAQIYQGVAQPNNSPPDGTGLVFDLMTHLESVIESGNPSSYLYRLLGDSYLQVGLIDAAQRQYETVIQLTALGQDLPSRAAAWVGLANIAALSGNREVAENYLQFAQVHYGAIADDSRVEQIDEWLSKLN